MSESDSQFPAGLFDDAIVCRVVVKPSSRVYQELSELPNGRGISARADRLLFYAELGWKLYGALDTMSFALGTAASPRDLGGAKDADIAPNSRGPTETAATIRREVSVDY